MTLYEILEVGKDASLEAIKRAFRTKAKHTHPDHGGRDNEAWLKVVRAYTILIDEGKREEYDRTGKEDDQPADTLESEARGMVLGMWSESVERELRESINTLVPRWRVNHISAVDARIKKEREESKELLRKVATAERFLEGVRKRIRGVKAKGEGEGEEGEGDGLLWEVLKGHRADVEKNRDIANHKIEVCEKALEMLGKSGWGYESDEEEAVMRSPSEEALREAFRAMQGIHMSWKG